MTGEHRCVFGGWEAVPGKSGEFRDKGVTVPTAPSFSQFTEQSRARWDATGWLKVKIKQLSSNRTPTKKLD